ncbi:uncharacterized protein CANTADRAFT_181058 [Suhomyces tanzawaensis NRRL Y-17324]|uniref:Uncharacterized protein n=1 Tax=Suhomyces tanzawaensis NRRL Y-17324 TaxID=984487 RepID=A0A1E4SN33_9ASCO|nr:uncharacterized protein CANTADRAFT_181058 [Suhomyces tanzawaensis NRRL Y-17324]ODV80930.1 hypothetical protein CANTADRAFT_181058 [Suhomyces tanzawaensis NRRL Y-17324]
MLGQSLDGERGNETGGESYKNGVVTVVPEDVDRVAPLVLERGAEPNYRFALFRKLRVLCSAGAAREAGGRMEWQEGSRSGLQKLSYDEDCKELD